MCSPGEMWDGGAQRRRASGGWREAISWEPLSGPHSSTLAPDLHSLSQHRIGLNRPLLHRRQVSTPCSLGIFLGGPIPTHPPFHTPQELQ